MLDSDADRLAMIQSLGGQLVRSEVGEFWAIFDNDYFEVLPGDRPGVATTQPRLTARTVDVEKLPTGTTLELGSEEYRVKRAHESDGTGMSRVLLKR